MLNISRHISLSRLTTLRIGGPTDYLITVTSELELKQAFIFSKDKSLPYLLIGGGSNLLVADSGFPGLVIKNNIAGIKKNNHLLIVKSGTQLQDLVDFSIKNGFGGMHKLTGIPGTVGGAIFGNAGAYGQTISDYLTQVVILNAVKDLKILTRKQSNFDYRDSIFKKNKFIILEAEFKFKKTKFSTLIEESQEVLLKRQLRYPINLKCPGSFFKNILSSDLPKSILNQIPREKIIYDKISAGYFLEVVGAKGKNLGKIIISKNHANLFINQGGGKALDFYRLAKKYQLKVKARFGVSLQPEVQIINLPPLN